MVKLGWRSLVVKSSFMVFLGAIQSYVAGDCSFLNKMSYEVYIFPSFLLEKFGLKKIHALPQGIIYASSWALRWNF